MIIKFFKSKETLFRQKRLWLLPDATNDTKVLPKIDQMVAPGISTYVEGTFLSRGQSPSLNYTVTNQPQEKVSPLPFRFETEFTLVFRCI